MQGLGPGPSDDLGVPAQKGRRFHEEGRPTVPAEEPCEHGQHGAVGRVYRRTCHLAAQPRQLVAQHDDLNVLLVGRRRSRSRSSRRRTSKKLSGRAIATILTTTQHRCSNHRSCACTLQAPSPGPKRPAYSGRTVGPRPFGRGGCGPGHRQRVVISGGVRRRRRKDHQASL